MNTLDQEKRTLRTRMKTLRAGLSDQTRREASARACAHLTQTALWREAGCVGLFRSMGAEISTEAVLEAAWAAGKTVAFPVTPRRGEALGFRRLERHTAWVRGPFGTSEPHPTSEALCLPTLELVVVPGLAFDRRGGRLGYGGGYYDRTLPHTGPAVMLAFACQEVERVPVGPWDQPLGCIVTEEGALSPGRAAQGSGV